MILEFIDKSQIEVLTIFGGPSLVNGSMRDTLTIEVDPNKINLIDLTDIFSNPNKCLRLFTYGTDEGNNVKTEIGLGYCIFVSCKEERRKKIHFPGRILPEEYETINVVTISQYTYEEWMAVLKKLETSDNEEEVMLWRYLHE